jgi:hypothetical protein
MMDDLREIFSSGHFKQHGARKFFGEIDGRKIGVVLATKGADYDSAALNRAEFNAALRGKREGRIDEAYVVAATFTNGRHVYWDHIEAEQLETKLANEAPRAGRFGEFYVLHSGIGFPATPDDSQPF